MLIRSFLSIQPFVKNIRLNNYRYKVTEIPGAVNYRVSNS